MSDIMSELSRLNDDELVQLDYVLHASEHSYKVAAMYANPDDVQTVNELNESCHDMSWLRWDVESLQDYRAELRHRFRQNNIVA